MEKDYEKIGKLIKLRREYAARLSPVEQAIEKERKGYSKEDQEYMAGEWFSRRLDAGLFSLQVSTVVSTFPKHASGTNEMNLRPSMSFWHGWLLKMTGLRRKLLRFLRTGTRICLWFAVLCKVCYMWRTAFRFSADSIGFQNNFRDLRRRSPGRKILRICSALCCSLFEITSSCWNVI